MTAKMASTLDTVSDGRLILGLGAGFKENEAEWVGVDFPPSVERLRRAGRAPRGDLADDPPGRAAGDASPASHVRVTNAANSPRTAGRDHIPLLIGGHGKEVTFRLAARYADEVNIDVMPGELVEHRDALARSLRRDRA